jgi:hypothetical protein
MHFGNPLQEIFMNTYRLLLLLPLLIAPSLGMAAEAHVHGVATLQIAVDGNQLQLSFSSPLNNLLGFEQMPRTDKQKAAVRHTAETLRQAERLFLPTQAAQCSLKSVELESPVLEKAPDKTHRHEGHEHADLDGEFMFICSKPAELRDLEVNLFGDFPLLKKLKTVAATPGGQTAATLNPNSKRISWK